MIFRVFSGLFFAFLAIAGSVSGQQLNFRNYSVGDGLAQSQVYAMIEDSRGYIWMGTRGGGLCRFDGSGFLTYTTEDGLIDNYILCLAEDADGTLWIGTNKGLSRFNGLEFETLDLENDLGFVSIGGICQDREGDIWIGTGKGLFRYDGQNVIRCLPKDGFPAGYVGDLMTDSKGQVWAGHDQGLTRVSGKTPLAYGKKQGLNSQVSCIREDANGSLWVGTMGDGVNVLKDNRITRMSTGTSAADKIFLSILHDEKGQVWTGTIQSGIKRWNPVDSSWTSITEIDGLANNNVRCLMQDSWGNLWIGTSGGGVSKYYGQQFVHYNERSGMPGQYVYSVLVDRQNRLWMGTSGLGVTLNGGAGYVRYGADSGFIEVKAKALFEDRKGRIWIGTEGQGLARYDDSSFVVYTGGDGLSNPWIKDIDQDNYGNIWVATAGGGITKLTPTDSNETKYDFEFFTRSRGMPKDRLNCLHLDRRGRIWFGMMSDGIGYILKDSVMSFPDNDRLPSGQIRCLAEDDYGDLWVGTAGGGIARIGLYQDSLPMQTFDRKDGLISGNVYLLLVDADQNLWVGTEAGIDQLVFDASRNLLEVQHFGKAEGFVGIECNQNAAWRDAEDNLWFGTINGLTRHNPRQKEPNPLPPVVSIHDVRLFYESLRNTDYDSLVGSWGQLKDKVIFPHDQNHLSFDFIGVNHKNPDKVRYQWRLRPFEEEWTPVSSRTDATYSNLPPGDYTFEVKACNEDGVWTATPSSLAFVVLRPYWETWWFRVSALGVIVLIIGLIFNLRLRAVKRANRQQQEQLQLEKGLLELEQKALRLQMNPHFIFNALNSIQGLIARKDDKTARFFLAKFSKLMRLILENSREGLITLEEEIATLESYLSLERFSRGDRFDYHIALGEKVDPGNTLIPPMMIQPFIENAVIHGVAHLETAGHIEVSFSRNGTHLICQVEDNGIGRKRAAEVKSQVGEHHKSTALAVTQERLDIINHTGAGQPSLAIEDLEDPKGQAKGTRVVLRVPLKSQF